MYRHTLSHACKKSICTIYIFFNNKLIVHGDCRDIDEFRPLLGTLLYCHEILTNMADWEEVKRLAADFQLAQLSSTKQK